MMLPHWASSLVTIDCESIFFRYSASPASAPVVNPLPQLPMKVDLNGALLDEFERDATKDAITLPIIIFLSQNVSETQSAADRKSGWKRRNSNGLELKSV